MADIFDEIELKDVFDEVESDRIGDKIFDEVEKELPSLVRSYVKEQTKKIKTLTAKEISNLVDAAISAIPKEKPTEKIIEKRIEVVPAKDTKKWAELSKIDEINERIDELKKSLRKDPDIRIVGEMLPNHNGIKGILQSDGNKLVWSELFGSESLVWSELFGSGSVTRDSDNLISNLTVGGKRISVTRDSNKFVSVIYNNGKTIAISRDSNNYISSWIVS